MKKLTLIAVVMLAGCGPEWTPPTAADAGAADVPDAGACCADPMAQITCSGMLCGIDTGIDGKLCVFGTGCNVVCADGPGWSACCRAHRNAGYPGDGCVRGPTEPKPAM